MYGGVALIREIERASRGTEVHQAHFLRLLLETPQRRPREVPRVVGAGEAEPRSRSDFVLLVHKDLRQLRAAMGKRAHDTTRLTQLGPHIHGGSVRVHAKDFDARCALSEEAARKAEQMARRKTVKSVARLPEC